MLSYEVNTLSANLSVVLSPHAYVERIGLKMRFRHAYFSSASNYIYREQHIDRHINDQLRTYVRIVYVAFSAQKNLI